jgi:hypothetical protein
MVALFAVITYRLLTGAINLRGLLLDKRTGALSPERVQVLVVMAVPLATIATEWDRMAATNRIGVAQNGPVAAFAVSQAVYLVAKLVRGRSTA